jgi:hypothetical protein
MENIPPEYQSFYSETLSWKTYEAKSEEKFGFLIFLKDLFYDYSNFYLSLYFFIISRFGYSENMFLNCWNIFILICFGK